MTLSVTEWILLANTNSFSLSHLKLIPEAVAKYMTMFVYRIWQEESQISAHQTLPTRTKRALLSLLPLLRPLPVSPHLISSLFPTLPLIPLIPLEPSSVPAILSCLVNLVMPRCKLVHSVATAREVIECRRVNTETLNTEVTLTLIFFFFFFFHSEIFLSND